MVSFQCVRDPAVTSNREQTRTHKKDVNLLTLVLLWCLFNWVSLMSHTGEGVHPHRLIIAGPYI